MYDTVLRVYPEPSYNETLNPEAPEIQPETSCVKIYHFYALLILCGSTGCATSADMAYKYQDNAETCVKLGREMARQTGDSSYKKALSQRYYQNCVGK